MTRQQRIVLACAACWTVPAFGRCESREIAPSLISQMPEIGSVESQPIPVTIAGNTSRSLSPPRSVMLMAGLGIALGLLIRSVKARGAH
jgi:hypothetical protein